MTSLQSLSQIELREIYEKHGGDLDAVAAELGLSAQPAPTYRRRDPPSDIGANQPSLRKHIISVRHVDWSTWPAADEPKILKARENYEAGTHEMCQGRDRSWFVLYSIPRKNRTGARKFFHALD